MKKLCIFDFDGTLFDSLTDVANCFNQTFEKLGFETFDISFYIKSLGGNINEITSKILKDKNSPENVELVKKVYGEIYSKDSKENTRLFEGMLEVLEQLQEEKTILAINSNRNPESIKYFLERYANHIDFLDIQGHVYTKPSKPDPEGVNTIIQKAGMTREDAVYIGDSLTDIQTAKNAQIDCILVKWGYGVGDVYENEYPIAVVENKDELLDVIKNS
ncbi:MAG TPA: HAD family hydrolase [Methanosphaera sp.]|nr:HAD family hydrolase [Methanosphaera sp.]HIJ15612.1 HAD family hydrolase [Methanosphaera sp.]